MFYSKLSETFQDTAFLGHTAFRKLDWIGLVKQGLVKRGLGKTWTSEKVEDTKPTVFIDTIISCGQRTSNINYQDYISIRNMRNRNI